jgi:hypothetical protein
LTAPFFPLRHVEKVPGRMAFKKYSRLYWKRISGEAEEEQGLSQ